MELESYFFDIVVDELERRGKILTDSEISELKSFFNKGISRMKNQPYEYWENVERDLKDKIDRIENVNSFSIRDILRKLCPLDPFC